MDMQHGHRHVAWTWTRTSSIYVHGHVHAHAQAHAAWAIPMLGGVIDTGEACIACVIDICENYLGGFNDNADQPYD